MRPPAPWSLASLRTLNALSGRPRVAATPAVTKATGSAPMVSPPMAVASGGTTESTASATSSMASGRHTVCLESMNQVLVRPRLEGEVARLDRVGEQVVAQRRRSVGRRHAKRTPGPPADDLADHRRGRLPGRRRARSSAASTAAASTTSAMPMPRLKTRSISSSATAPRRWISPKIGGSSQRRRARARRRSPRAARGAGCPTIPPPVMCAHACSAVAQRGAHGQHGRRVDHRGAQQLVGHAVRRPGPGRDRRARARPARAARGGPACSRWIAGRARPARRRRRRRAPVRGRAGSRPRRPRRRSPARSSSSGAMTPACSAVSPPISAQPACRQPSWTPATTVATRSGSTLPVAT